MRQAFIRRNRLILERLFNIVRLLGRLSLPFRGHDESEMSLHRGIFLVFVSYLAENGDHILANHLQEASSNAKYLSPRIQNEMIEIVGHEVRLEIVRRVKKSGVFDVLMDETTDVSHKEQVAIFVRYVSTTENIAIEERMLALVDTDVTTG